MAYNVNTDLVRADDLFLYITSANSVVAFATSCSVQIDGETIDTSNKMSGRWNSNLGGKNGYTISADALYTQVDGHFSFDKLMELMVASNEAVAWSVGFAKDKESFDLDTTKPYYSGEAFVTSLSLSGGNNEVASCSITLTGSGAIEKH